MNLQEEIDSASGVPDNSFGNWTLIVAVSSNGVIGHKGSLPWRLSSDLRRFKRLTMGHCLLMGRKTFESIGRALPGRQTICLSRNAAVNYGPGVQVASCLEDVLDLVEKGRRVMVVGGADVYRLTLPVCGFLWITRVLADVPGDTYFPEVDWHEWELLSSIHFDSGPNDEWPTDFQQWQRKKVIL